MATLYPMWNLDRFYYRYTDELLRIGTDDVNSWNIPDPEGTWEKLITLCNGKNSLEYIQDDMLTNHKISFDMTKDAILQFVSSLSITMLNEPWTDDSWHERFRTNIAYLTKNNVNGYELQKKLTKMKVTILGFGGGGSTVFKHLLSLGVGDIHIVDFDTISLSNINRQGLFTELDIDKSKVDVGVEYAKKYNSSITVTSSKTKLQLVSDVEKEINGSDWVFCCLDEPIYVAQRTVNKACNQLKIPCVYGFCQKNNGRVFFVNPDETGCVDCLFMDTANESFTHLVTALTNSNFVPSTAATSFSIELLCSWMVKQWVDAISTNTIKGNQLLRLDFDDMSIKTVTEWTKNSECPTCGSKTATTNNIFNLIPINH